MDLTTVLVVGVVDGQDTVGSPGLSAPAEKKNLEEKKSSAKSGMSDKPTDYCIDNLDQKWSDWFNRL